MSNPYQFNQLPPPGQQPTVLKRPAVVLWYYLYCACMVLLYVLVAIAGLGAVIYGIENLDIEIDPKELNVVRVQSVFFGLVGVLFAGLFLLGIMAPRKKWGWITGIALICVGLSNCCCLPFGIPLLIFWLRADCKNWYGM